MSDSTSPKAATQTEFLTDVLTNLSHEMRTPLAAAKGFTTSLLRHDRKLSRSERLMMLQEIDKACLRLESVIEQALQTTRLLHDQIDLQHQPLDLVAMTQQAVATMEQTHQETKVPCS